MFGYRFDLDGPQFRWSPESIGLDARSSAGEMIRRLIESRPATITGSADETAVGVVIPLAAAVYDDGVSRHNLLGAIDELRATNGCHGWIDGRLLLDLPSGTVVRPAGV